MGSLGLSPLNLTLTSNKNPQNQIGDYSVISFDDNNKGSYIKSLFGNSKMAIFPDNIDKSTGIVTSVKDPSKYHNDENYDISTDSLVKYTSDYKGMKLKYADFAYLKNIGVYPNNRLIIARRFASGVKNDLTSINTEPLATLISWVPDDNNFIEVSFGEEWDQADASFTDILNDLGNDVLVGDNKGGQLGNMLSGGAGVVPLPGFMEGLQYDVMKRMGITDTDAGNLPGGNPNLIREAKKRKTLKKGSAGSGLKADISIKMSIEYEQKVINGIDPTLIYFDIISNALSFATSNAQFQFTSSFAEGTQGLIGKLISGDVKAIGEFLSSFVENLLESIGKVAQDLINNLVNPPSKDTTATPDPNLIFDSIKIAVSKTIGSVVGKYKIKLIGVANALTGSPSAPWHVTIGNPKRPMFSSGDMIVDEVKLAMGKTLSFNDLPSSIKIEFTLKNARNLGAQEIFNRFNTGRGRSYTRIRKSYEESNEKTEISEQRAAELLDKGRNQQQ